MRDELVPVLGLDVGVEVGALVTAPPPQGVEPQERSNELEMYIVEPVQERRTCDQEPVVETSWNDSPERALPIGLPAKTSLDNSPKTKQVAT
jgi:hypothetical protein